MEPAATEAPDYRDYTHETVKVLSSRDHSENDPNVRATFRRGLPRLTSLPDWGTKKPQPFALVAGGPSTRQCIDIIRQVKDVMVAGSAHDYLVQQGIKPTYAVCGDPDKIMVRFYQHIDPDCIYLVASHCDRRIFRHFKERKAKVIVWHALGEATEAEFKNELTIGGGCTAALRGIVIGAMMGYQQFHFFGMDSSYEDNGTTHAYNYGLPMPEIKQCKIGSGDTAKHFTSSVMFCGQALQFFETMKALRHSIAGVIYGDGMIAAMAKEELRKQAVAQAYGADSILNPGAKTVA